MKKSITKKLLASIMSVLIIFTFLGFLPSTAFAAETVTTLASGFNDPEGVAVDISGNIYFTDKDGVYRMDSNGGNIIPLGSGFSWAWGIALGSGNIYVANQGDNSIKRMDLNGNNIITLGSGFSNPAGIALSGGYIYVADSDHNAIKRMDSSGGSITTLGSGFSYPYGIALSSGYIYIADSGHNAIKRMNTDGSNIITLGSGFYNLMGVAVDSSGNIYVADTGNNAIKRMDSSGNNIITLGSGFRPQGVAVDSSGNVYVADTFNHAIKKITFGKALTSITITTPPTKTVYVVGQSLVLTGLVVTGSYNDGTTATLSVTASNINGFDSSTPVTGQIVTVTVDGKTATFTVNIIANTSPGTALQQIQAIESFFNAAVQDGSLTAFSSKQNAQGQLRAFANMLKQAENLIAQGDYAAAIQQLQAAYAKVDGQPNPPDFVKGDAAATLAQMIQDLITYLSGL